MTKNLTMEQQGLAALDQAVAAVNTEREAATAVPASDDMAALMAVRARMNEILLERSAEIDGVLMAILAESTVLFLGPVGTAKTMLVTTACRLMGLRDFEILMSESTKADQIFGPINVPELAAGRQVYKWKDYAPGAQVLFFDEIFKANGTVLNPLLWLINDHRFRNGDEGMVDTEATTTFAASNELPRESILGAVYDRLMLRYVVEYLEDNKSVKTGIRAVLAERQVLKPLMNHETVQSLRALTRSVAIPEMVMDAALRVRQVLAQKDVMVSDRRFFKAFSLVQAQAVLNGRIEANLDDLGVLSHLFWHDYEQIEQVVEVVARSTGVGAEILSSYMEEAQLLANDLLKGDLRAKLREFKKIREAIKGYQGLYAAQVKKFVNGCGRRLRDSIAARTTLILYKSWSSREGSMIYKLAAESADAWNPGALTNMGFRRRRNPSYFYTLEMRPIREAAKEQGIKVVVKEAPDGEQRDGGSGD